MNSAHLIDECARPLGGGEGAARRLDGSTARTPLDVTEGRVLAAILYFPGAAEHVRTLPFDAAALFTNHAVGAFVTALVDGGTLGLIGSPDEQRAIRAAVADAELWYRAIDWTDPRAFDRFKGWTRILIARRAEMILAPTLRWGAAALESGRGIERVRAELRAVFALAEGRAA